MSPQQTIAHYRIVSKLGEGGMGAVYRATDTKLNREVAIKVLPGAFAQDAARMARFEREAQILASLNHPNIAAIYGIEQGAIVMELVEGEDLKGPVSIDTAIDYARQIAAGLEVAHEKGIVHRDLKPANIKVTPDGGVKILDFGLAKAGEDAAPVSNTSLSPTMSLAMTQAGMILGTAAYMAPEQARGKTVDRRADIWAYGVILFELLTGRHPFGSGETVTDIIAAVVIKEPDLAALPAATPARLKSLIGRCLRKDPKLRLRDIGDARLTLDEQEPETVAPSAKRAWLPWTVAALGLAVGAAAFVTQSLQPKPAAPVAIKFPLGLPEGVTTWGGPAGANEVPSPDGRSIVFLGRSEDGRVALWLRPMDSPSAHLLDKTDAAALPFWSPDSQFIAFFSDGKLKKIPAAGGAFVTICDLKQGGSANAGAGGTWNAAGAILFGGPNGGVIMRVAAAGGQATPVTALDEKTGETAHAWPQFLPDGRHFLYFARNSAGDKSALFVQELGSTQRTLVMRNRVRGAWSPPGYLLFPRDSRLFAQRMDARTFQLAGEPELISDAVNSGGGGAAAFSVSPAGVLVYRTDNLAAVRPGQLSWYGRDGVRLGSVGKADRYTSIRLSPDEKSLAATIGIAPQSDTFVMDLGTGVLTRVTSDGNSAGLQTPWSPDSQRVAINRTEPPGILELTVASGKTRLLTSDPLTAVDWSPDNRFLLCTNGAGTILSLLPLEESAKPHVISETQELRNNFEISPDGKFVAYSSGGAPDAQIFVASLPAFSEKRQVSKDGGAYPTWRKDGREIFFRSRDGGLMAVEIKTGAKIETGIPKPLFKYSAGQRGQTYTPSGDGKRFLVKESERTESVPVTVVVNWTAELKQ